MEPATVVPSLEAAVVVVGTLSAGATHLSSILRRIIWTSPFRETKPCAGESEGVAMELGGVE